MFCSYQTNALGLESMFLPHATKFTAFCVRPCTRFVREHHPPSPNQGRLTQNDNGFSRKMTRT